MIKVRLLVLTLGVVAACGGDPPVIGPTPGEVSVMLQSANGQEGAILFRVAGAVTGVSAARGFHLSSASTGDVLRIVVAGDLSAGELARLTIPDVDHPPSVFVEQVASRTTYGLFDPGGYSLGLLRR